MAKCIMRNVKEENDYCGEITVRGGKYCKKHTCMIKGCKGQATVWFPLIEGEPRFCHKHHTNKNLHKYVHEGNPITDYDVIVH